MKVVACCSKCYSTHDVVHNAVRSRFGYSTCTWDEKTFLLHTAPIGEFILFWSRKSSERNTTTRKFDSDSRPRAKCLITLPNNSLPLSLPNIYQPNRLATIMEPKILPTEPKRIKPPKLGGLRHLERLLGLREGDVISTDAVFLSLDLEVGSDRQRLHLLRGKPVVN